MSVHLEIDDGIAFIEFDQKDSRVNLLSWDILKKLDGVLGQVAGQANLRAAVFFSKKANVFIAGADITAIESIKEESEAAAKAAAGQAVLNRIEDLSFPTVAFIDGSALGGGCELALACRYRVATFNDKVQIGLPEVNLGIIPGFGGTWRLPRLVGLNQGLKMILTGKLLSGREALKTGLVNRLVPYHGWQAAVRDFLADPSASISMRRRSRVPFWQKWLEETRLGQGLIFRQARQGVLRSTGGHYPAPLTALDVLEKNFYCSRQSGLQIEAQAVGKLIVSPQAKNLIHVFHLQEKYKKLVLPGHERLPDFRARKCVVVGAGVMGGGIAQLLAFRDIDVRLKDITAEAAARGLQAAARLFHQLVTRRKMSAQAAELKMDRVSWATDNRGLMNADCVIEAVVEDLEVKKKIFHELSRVVGPRTLLCTNTSALSVTEMAKAAEYPERLVGFHFFNPVHRMPLIEVVRSPLTSPDSVGSALALARQLGKTAILVNDAPGFLVNRILLSYINEAGLLLEEGAGVEDLDRVMTEFGLPMGPFRLSDEVGLEVGVKVLHILHQGLGERFRPAAVFDDVARAGLRGKKGGEGFYLYGKSVTPNPAVERLIKRRAKAATAPDAYLNRMLMVMVNEAARCLADGVVGESSDVDAGMIWGTGFPPFRGGLLRYADQVGIRKIVEMLKFFAWQGEGFKRFEPCSYLLNLERDRLGFYGSTQGSH